MRRCAAVVALLAVLLAGAGVPVPARPGWTTTTVTYQFDGLTRSYVVVRPLVHAAVLPVLVELHGCCTTPYHELDRGGFTTATGRGAILVYPAGYDGFWNAGACCGATEADDVSFVADVVSRVLRSERAADPSRVYLVGYSNGGRMAYRIACRRPGLFAAIAVFGAVSAFPCSHPPPVRILIAAGDDDPELTVPLYGMPHVTGGYLEPSVTGQAEIFAAAGSRVELLLLAGVDHAWPPGLATVIWRFLSSGSATPPSCARGRRPGRPPSRSGGGWPAAGRRC
jgi:polyhydroxybutyrate depolymerase